MMPAESYAAFLEELVVVQERAQLHIRVLLEANIAAVVPVTVAYALKFFGSRAFEPRGYCLPSSDFDFVCELAADAHAYGFPPKLFLQLVYERLRADARCTDLNNAIDYKWTVEFRFAEVKVDFTVCVGPAADHHGPSQFTSSLCWAFSALPELGCRLQRLLVDWAKRSQVCYDRKGAVGHKLKAVHWAMLAAAWWSYHVAAAGPVFFGGVGLGRMLFEVLRFYALFDFDKFVIVPVMAGELNYVPFIPCESVVPRVTFFIYLCDPVYLRRGVWRNLGCRVDRAAFQAIHNMLCDAANLLQQPHQHHAHFLDAKRRWEVFSNRLYEPTGHA